MTSQKIKTPHGNGASFGTVCTCGRANPTASQSSARVLAVRDRLLFLADRTLSDPNATRPELRGQRAALMEILSVLPPSENYVVVLALQTLFSRRAQMDLLAESALLIKRRGQS